MAQPKTIAWTPRALRELFEVGDYIEQQFGSLVADKFVKDAFLQANHLSNFPELGRLSKHFKTVRWLLLGKHHRMYCRVKGSSVRIIRLLDSRRNPKRNPYG